MHTELDVNLEKQVIEGYALVRYRVPSSNADSAAYLMHQSSSRPLCPWCLPALLLQLSLTAHKDGVQQLQLDTRDLTIHSADAGGQALQFQLGEPHQVGTAC
jgi:hypothetical protein